MNRLLEFVFRVFLSTAMILWAGFVSAQAGTGTASYSIFWWNPSLNGMGIHTEQQGNTVALVWYHYTASRNATFLIAACALTKIAGKDGCTAQLSRSTGPAPQGYDQGQLTTGVNVGTMTVVFDSTSQITFTYNYQDVGGSTQAGSFTMVPFVFSTAPVVGLNYSNFWWNRVENGMGYTTEQQGGVVAGVWYHYTVSRRATFHIWSCQALTKDSLGRDVCTGQLSRSFGPAPQGYDASQVQVGVNVGSVTVTFDSGRAARIAYDYTDEAGQRQVGTTSIEPFLFGQKYSSKLVMSAGNGMDNGIVNGTPIPISVFDLNAGTVQDLPFAAASCPGVAMNVVTTDVHILCTAGQTRIYNPATGVLRAGPTFPTIISDSAAVACGANGLCAYGFGASSNSNFLGRVALVNSNGTVKSANIPFPDQATGRTPSFARAIGNKIYIITRGFANSPSSINRFDTTTERFDVGGSTTTPFIEMDAEAFIEPMALTADTIYVSVRRAADGKDVLAFDLISGARLPSRDLSIPGGFQGQFNALGLAASASTLYVATQSGARAYNLSTMLPMPNGVYSESRNGFRSAAYSQALDSVYMSESSGGTIGRINRFSASTVAVPNGGFDKGVGTGRLTIIE